MGVYHHTYNRQITQGPPVTANPETVEGMLESLGKGTSYMLVSFFFFFFNYLTLTSPTSLIPSLWELISWKSYEHFILLKFPSANQVLIRFILQVIYSSFWRSHLRRMSC